MIDRDAMRRYVEERSIPVPEAGCWIWLQSSGSHGYGNACTETTGATVAHRVSFIAFVGDIPDGMLVQHRCDTKLCVAPAHLSLGTDATNATDKQLKGRAAKKLTHRDVLEIRKRLARNEAQLTIAKVVGVSQRLVWMIKHGRVWRHVQLAHAVND